MDDSVQGNREETITRRENQLRILMAVYALLYLVFGILLLVYPGGILRLINEITGLLGFETPLHIPAHPFWAMICVSLLLLLAVMCYMAYLDIREKRLLVRLMIFAKYTSVACQLLYLVFSRDHPPGFALGAIVDGFLGTLALIFLLRARGNPGG